MDRLYVIGLGNPGKAYQDTRHNVGWLFVDFVAQRESLNFNPGKGDFVVAEGNNFCLFKPAVFMNLSGIAVKQIVDLYALDDLNKLIIVHDDADIKFGKLRLRLKGSSGGHRGVESIIYYLGTEEFPRLKIGIGRKEDIELRDYVLSPFNKEEKEKLTEVFEKGYRGLKLYRDEGPLKAMNFINTDS